MGVNDAGSCATAALIFLHGYISIGKSALCGNVRKTPPGKGSVAAFSKEAILPFPEYCPLA
jgi:hypothetical protein